MPRGRKRVVIDETPAAPAGDVVCWEVVSTRFGDLDAAFNNLDAAENYIKLMKRKDRSRRLMLHRKRLYASATEALVRRG